MTSPTTCCLHRQSPHCSIDFLHFCKEQGPWDWFTTSWGDPTDTQPGSLELCVPMSKPDKVLITLSPLACCILHTVHHAAGASESSMLRRWQFWGDRSEICWKPDKIKAKQHLTGTSNTQFHTERAKAWIFSTGCQLTMTLSLQNSQQLWQSLVITIWCAALQEMADGAINQRIPAPCSWCWTCCSFFGYLCCRLLWHAVPAIILSFEAFNLCWSGSWLQITFVCFKWKCISKIIPLIKNVKTQ